MVNNKTLDLMEWVYTANRYFGYRPSLTDIKDSLRTHLSSCYRCDSQTTENSRYIILSNNYILKSICPKCVEDLISGKNTLFRCQACGSPTRTLYEHHWWTPLSNTKHHRKVCQSCNTRLKAKSLWVKYPHLSILPNSHILPHWNLQLLYINNNKRSCYRHERDRYYNNKWITLQTLTRESEPRKR